MYKLLQKYRLWITWICEGCVQASSVSEDNFAKAPLVLADGNIPTQSLGNNEY